MPERGRFAREEDYWATLAHEAVHWTRHESRLERDLGRQAWGDEGYAREELVAEIGSAFLCAELGIWPVVREDHAQYIGPWLMKLDGDPQAIFEAAALASKAVTWIGERVRSARWRYGAVGWSTDPKPNRRPAAPASDLPPPMPAAPPGGAAGQLSLGL